MNHSAQFLEPPVTAVPMPPNRPTFQRSTRLFEPGSMYPQSSGSSTPVVRGTRAVGVSHIGLVELGQLVMGFRTETAGGRSWAGYDPLRNSKIRGSNFQGIRSLVRCVGPCSGYLSSAGRLMLLGGTTPGDGDFLLSFTLSDSSSRNLS